MGRLGWLSLIGSHNLAMVESDAVTANVLYYTSNSHALSTNEQGNAVSLVGVEIGVGGMILKKDPHSLTTCRIHVPNQP